MYFESTLSIRIFVILFYTSLNMLKICGNVKSEVSHIKFLSPHRVCATFYDRSSNSHIGDIILARST